MVKKRVITVLAAALATLLLAVPALAQGAKTFAVIPFTYNGPQKYAYFPKAFQASLNNDLEWIGQVEPTTKTLAKVDNVSSQAQALGIIQNNNLDYLVYGDIAIINKDAHLNIKVTDKTGATWSQKGEMGIDQIAGWLDNQSHVIQGDVFNRPGYGTSTKKAAEKEAAPKAPLSAGIIDAHATTADQSLNPQFRYEGGTGTEGRWRSQTLPFTSRSMVVVDGDGDGKNEVYILQDECLNAYRFDSGKLKLITSFALPPNVTNLRLEVADLNKDGIMEFIIGGYQVEVSKADSAQDGTPKSSILDFKDGKFQYVVKKFSKFLGVLRMPPTYTPVLVAESKGDRYVFDKDVYEAYIKGDDVELGQKLHLPPFANVYNMTYIPSGLGFNYAVLSNKHKLVTYTQAFERLNETEETYNSSSTVIQRKDRMLGGAIGASDSYVETYSVPIRMIAAKLTDKTKYELLVNKDLSTSAQVFQNYHTYSQGEIHSMVWDGVGLNLAWKTRRIKGEVADIALADLNNDGHKQLCILVNTFTGSGFGNRKTVVLAYDLNLDK